MSTVSKELKAAKDAVIVSLAALSKASSDAASATAGFFKVLDSETGSSEEIKELATTLAVLGSSVKDVDEQIPLLAAELTGKKLPPAKKPKVERDPNAPKKPLTAFFKYSADVRDDIRNQRAAKGEPSLSSVEMTQIISAKWKELSEKEKDEWKHKYHEELVEYNEAAEKYKKEKLANGGVVVETTTGITEEPVSAAKIESKHDSSKHTHSDKKSKKRKSEEESEEKKKEKKKEKKNKKKSSSS